MYSVVLKSLFNICLALLLMVLSITPVFAQTQLVVGYEENPPIAFTGKTGAPTGISVDLLTHIAAREQWQLIWKSCKWEKCLEGLTDGTIDLLVGIGHTKEREALYSFTAEPVMVNWGQLYAAKNQSVSTMLDLEGKRIALVPTDSHGKAFAEMLTRFGIKSQVVEAASYSKALQAVIQGQADAGIISRIYPLNATEADKVVQTPIIFNPVQNKYATSKDRYRDVLQAIDANILSLKADKGLFYYRNMKNWIEVPADHSIPTWIWWCIGLGTIIFGSATYWWHNRREVKLKQQLQLNHALEDEIALRTQLEQQVLQRTRDLEDSNYELNHINSELVHKRLELEKNQIHLQKLSRAVENSPATIVITSREGLIEYVNPKFTEITGYLPEEAIGQNPRILKAPDKPPELYRELWDTILAGNEWHGDFCNKKKNGVLYWERASISPIRDEQGTITHFVAIKEDITEQKRIAAELLAAQEQALAASRAKSQFLANMSHEIRTPLNAIIGFSSLCLNTGLMPDQKNYIGKVHTAGELLLRIINDILDFSKIEAGQLHMEQIPFRLGVMLDNAAGMVQQKAQDKGLVLLVTCAPEISSGLIGDPHRLSQVLVNLLNNAVKFTQNGSVTLDITLLEQKDDQTHLKFSVRDTGIGITPEQQCRLFQPFSQADGSTTRRFGGTGLGLSISKQLVELMGGEIWCESAAEQGSVFSFTAWFGIWQGNGQADENQETVQPETTFFDFSDLKILLAEDNDFNRQLAIAFLKETNATVETAVNGKEAVEKIISGATRYDLVLMDIQMPVMDGYEASRCIRSDSRFAHLPIIAMTAHAMQEEGQKILEAGMDAHLTKPVNARTMLQTIQLFAGRPGGFGQQQQRITDDTDTTFELPDIAGIDAAEALINLDGDKKLFLWVLETFAEKQAVAARLIEAALDSGDTELAIRTVHTIKGNAGIIGAKKLGELADTLEKAIAQDDPPEHIMPALDDFSVELTRLIDELTSRLKPVLKDDEPLPPMLDTERASLVLSELCGYIKTRNCKAEHYLDDYQQELTGLPVKEINRLKQNLADFDFTAAERTLLGLALQNGLTL
jgi:PAS domain S-box-containing protein